ncbi:CCHC-type domain-containing protein [Mycena kentingensis (nom. inval.)]|nr:CCHC-type domain-containing protein [Mycena kentingensis (nom. inval.)]
MAERLAHNGTAESGTELDTLPEIKRSDKFPRVKNEERDVRIDELGGEVASLRDAVVVVQKQQKASHDELMRAFQNSRVSASGREEGMGSMAARVEEYWARKGSVGQNLYAEGGAGQGGLNDDEFDMLRDEIRTLRVKFNQLSTQHTSSDAPTQQTFMAASPPTHPIPTPSPAANQAIPVPQVNMDASRGAVCADTRSNSGCSWKHGGVGFLKDSRMEAVSKSTPPEDRQTRQLDGRGEAEVGRAKAEIGGSKNSALKELPYRFVQANGGGVRTQPPPPRDEQRREPDDLGKAYKLRAPIQRDGLTEEMLERINETEVTVRLGDLFGLSKDLREGERLRLTRVRQPVEKGGVLPELVVPAEMGVKEQVAATRQNTGAVGVNLNSDALEMGALPEVEGVVIPYEQRTKLALGAEIESLLDVSSETLDALEAEPEEVAEYSGPDIQFEGLPLREAQDGTIEVADGREEISAAWDQDWDNKVEDPEPGDALSEAGGSIELPESGPRRSTRPKKPRVRMS